MKTWWKQRRIFECVGNGVEALRNFVNHNIERQKSLVSREFMKVSLKNLLLKFLTTFNDSLTIWIIARPEFQSKTTYKMMQAFLKGQKNIPKESTSSAQSSSADANTLKELKKANRPLPWIEK